MKLRILYRGPLESCNYGCDYCPFAKKVDTRADLTRDRAALFRFVAWVKQRREDRFGILITPWGEGLTRAWYREALCELSSLPQVERAAIQSNLSCDLAWTSQAGPSLALWATYHPEWCERARFVEKIAYLHEHGVRVSCGAVGFPRLLDDIEALRRALPREVYLWINAPKSSGVVYRDDERRRLLAIDPLFSYNTVHHPSRGRLCQAGHRVIAVDGDGTMRRCHFIDEPIGNLYAPDFAEALRPRPCSNDTCGCHIGYVHLEHLELTRIFGDGILERIPDRRYLPIQPAH